MGLETKRDIWIILAILCGTGLAEARKRVLSRLYE